MAPKALSFFSRIRELKGRWPVCLLQLEWEENAFTFYVLFDIHLGDWKVTGGLVLWLCIRARKRLLLSGSTLLLLYLLHCGSGTASDVRYGITALVEKSKK